MQNDLPQFEPVLDRLFSSKTLGSDFLKNCGLVVSNFLWVSSPVCILSREPKKFVSSFSCHIFRGRNSECVLNFSTWNRLLHLRQPLLHHPIAVCRVILGRKWFKCAQTGIERDRSRLVENTVPLDIRKIRKFKPEFLVEWNTPCFYFQIFCDSAIPRRFCDSGKDCNFQAFCDFGKEHSTILARSVILKHSAILQFWQGAGGNKQKVRHFRRHFDIDVLNWTYSVLHSDPASSQFTQPPKRTNEFSNWNARVHPAYVPSA